MKSFREYSDKYSFKERSENAVIATELSLQVMFFEPSRRGRNNQCMFQPWKQFGTDGVIMFSGTSCVNWELAGVNNPCTLMPQIS
jgi:hypothetical protein